MRRFAPTDEGFKAELPYWTGFHVTSVFTALIQSPVMCLDLRVPSCVVSVNSPSGRASFLPLFALVFRYHYVVCLFFPLREESW